jgi:hypothetical protein
MKRPFQVNEHLFFAVVAISAAVAASSVTLLCVLFVARVGAGTR